VSRYEPPNDQHRFINFRSTRPTTRVAFHDHVRAGSVLFVSGRSHPIKSLLVRSSQVAVALHEGEILRMDWRPGESDRLCSKEIQRDAGDGRVPFWVRTYGAAPFFAIAMDEAFVSEIWEKEFGQARNFELRAAIGVRDPVISQIGLLACKELREGGIGGRLYIESLGTALAVHLLRQYGTSPRAPAIYKGGIAARPLQRVISYVNENLEEPLSLAELARVANLSPHHFATVFKASTGMSPHRYVIEKRLERARDLLRRNHHSISEIAYAVGFSSQSHLTAHFRQTAGLTPRGFRQSLN